MEYYTSLIDDVLDLSIEAGDKIMEIFVKKNTVLYDTVQYKSDGSPVTEADLAANKIIVNGLKKLTPFFPIISEEGSRPKLKTRHVWLVDPLDGTKEFIKGSSDFTVNIALVKDGRPVLGVVYVPYLMDIYWGIPGAGAYKNGLPIQAAQYNLRQELRFVASQSHFDSRTEEYMNSFSIKSRECRGSSLKFLLVAEGKADMYPRTGWTMEWDTCAADAILTASGGKVYQFGTGRLLMYNKDDLRNPFFLAVGENTMKIEI